jgi:hypothetical protein
VFLSFIGIISCQTLIGQPVIVGTDNSVHMYNYDHEYEYGYIIRYGERNYENVSSDDNFISVSLETKSYEEGGSNEKDYQFPIQFYFKSDNLREIKLNKVFIIKNDNKLDVTDRLVFIKRGRDSRDRYFENEIGIENGIIVDNKYFGDNIRSEFPIIIYESTITKKDKEFYIEYDFDVEFKNSHHVNFNNTVKMNRYADKIDNSSFLERVIESAFAWILLILVFGL